MGAAGTTKRIDRCRNRKSHRKEPFGMIITHRNKTRVLKRHLKSHPDDKSAIIALAKYK